MMFNLSKSYVIRASTIIQEPFIILIFEVRVIEVPWMVKESLEVSMSSSKVFNNYLTLVGFKVYNSI